MLKVKVTASRQGDKCIHVDASRSLYSSLCILCLEASLDLLMHVCFCCAMFNFFSTKLTVCLEKHLQHDLQLLFFF